MIYVTLAFQASTSTEAYRLLLIKQAPSMQIYITQNVCNLTAFGIPPALWLLPERPKAGLLACLSRLARLARLARWLAAAGAPALARCGYDTGYGWLAGFCV